MLLPARPGRLGPGPARRRLRADDRCRGSRWCRRHDGPAACATASSAPPSAWPACAPLTGYQGAVDPAGYELRTTSVAVADELAAAADLVLGKLERVPAALVRGFAGRRRRHGRRADPPGRSRPVPLSPLNRAAAGQVVRRVDVERDSRQVDDRRAEPGPLGRPRMHLRAPRLAEPRRQRRGGADRQRVGAGVAGPADHDGAGLRLVGQPPHLGGVSSGRSPARYSTAAGCGRARCGRARAPRSRAVRRRTRRPLPAGRPGRPRAGSELASATRSHPGLEGHGRHVLDHRLASASGAPRARAPGPAGAWRRPAA